MLGLQVAKGWPGPKVSVFPASRSKNDSHLHVKYIEAVSGMFVDALQKKSNKSIPVKGGKGKKKKKQVLKFTVDCSHPVEDGIMDCANFVSSVLHSSRR